MKNTIEQIQLYYELSMAIGNSLDLQTMLKQALRTYLKKLTCVSALVFKDSENNSTIDDELVFSIPFLLNVKDIFLKLTPVIDDYKRNKNKKVNSVGEIQNNQFYHIMPLDNFGFLILIKSGKPLKKEILFSLKDINYKLSHACLACIKNDQLITSEKRYRDLSELLPEMVCETNLDGVITFANKYALDKMGYTKNDVSKGFSVFDLFDEKEREKAINSFNAALQQDSLPPRDYIIRRKNGEVFPVLVYTNRLISNNKIEGIRGVMIDISERKEAESKLLQYTERLELALKGSDAGLWDWDIKTGHVFFSERWCNMLGYSQSEIEPNVSSWEKIVHPDDMQAITDILNAHLEGKTEMYQTEHRVKTKTGDWKWVLDTGKVTQRDTNGKALRAVGTHIDITEKKHIENLDAIEKDLSIKLSMAKNLDETLKICLDMAIQYSGMDSGGIYVLDEKADGLRLLNHKGLSGDFVKDTSFYPSASPNAQIIYKGKPIYSNHEQLLKQNNLTAKTEVLNALAVLPLLHFGKVIGCVNMASRKYNEISLQSREILEHIASYIGSFIAQAKQEEELNRQRQDLVTLFNTIDDFLFILDMKGNIIYFNSIVINRLGYESNELLGQHVLKVHPEYRHKEATQKITGMLMGTEKACLVPLITKNEIEIPVETKVMQGIWGSEKALFGISRDISERILFEQKLKENNERLEMALIASDAGLWDWNISTGDLTLNEKWHTMRGFNQADIVKNVSSWKKMLHPNDEVSVMDALNNHLQNKTAFYQAEYRTLTKSGKYIWVLDTGRVTEFNSNGEPVRMVGTNIDINLKKINELELQQNLKQQELLSEIALDLNSLDSFEKQIVSVLKSIGEHTEVSRVYIFEDDNDGKTTSNTYEWCNKGIQEQIDDLQGIPYEIIPSWKRIIEAEGRLYSENIADLPQDLREILEPQDIQSIIIYPLYVKELFFGFIGFDECVRNKNWSKSELELLKTVSGIIANAFERKISEQSLKESEAKNRAILESMPDILFHFNKEGRILSFNSSSKNDLAEIPENFINKTVYEIFPASFADLITGAIKKCLAENSYKLEYTIPIKNIPTDFEARMAKMNDNEVISIVRNVSERKEYERQLKAERDKANKANQSKSEFLANMSHEIRTPMNAILGFSEALYHKIESVHQQKMVKSIVNSGNLLLSLLNDILDLSKIEAGKMEISPQPTDVTNIANEIEMLFSDKVKEKNIKLNIVIDSDFPSALNLDELRTKQVLFNLVGNAVKFTHHGEVEVKLSFHPKNEDSGELCICIKDTGIGIPEKEHQRIFEAFTQKEGQSNRKYGGTGLGLAISNRLVNKMGGNIQLISNLNKGSTFSVILPDTKIASVRKRTIGNEDFDIQNITFHENVIMIVDDVETNIKAVIELLGDGGLKTVSAESGDIALEILNHTIPSLILLDLRMPGTDGFEVAKIVKSKPELKIIPIIAYTASVFSSSKIDNTGHFSGCLFKPVNKTELYKELMKFLPYDNIKIPKQEGASFDTGKFEIPEQTKAKIPEIISILETKLKPIWDEIKESLVLFKIETFIEEIKKIGETYHIQFIIVYANTLQDDMDLLDFKSLNKNLLKFPEIITQLKNIK